MITYERSFSNEVFPTRGTAARERHRHAGAAAGNGQRSIPPCRFGGHPRAHDRERRSAIEPCGFSHVAHGPLPGLGSAHGDAQLLRLLLENLLRNAWKFTGKKDDARIEFGSQLQDGKPVYFVRDNGAGFNMESAEKIFHAFQRLHNQSDFPGTGIGLATVQRVIERHGGKIWAESEEEKGATFYFNLPLPS